MSDRGASSGDPVSERTVDSYRTSRKGSDGRSPYRGSEYLAQTWKEASGFYAILCLSLVCEYPTTWLTSSTMIPRLAERCGLLSQVPEEDYADSSGEDGVLYGSG